MQQADAPSKYAKVRIACVDVDYRADCAIAAGLWFTGWSAAAATHEAIAVIENVAPYQPGEFYRRELPALLAVLAKGPAVDVVIVDGYVWLENGRPGLGAHLHDALGKQPIVVGVAKTRYDSAANVVPVCRGKSRAELYVSAAGADVEEVAREVAGMNGEFRLPTLLKQVDRKAREYTHTPSIIDLTNSDARRSQSRTR